MKIEVAVASDVGRMRDHNEDFAVIDEGLGLYVVCDGMGGHAAGEVAAEMACRTVVETIRAAAGPNHGGGELPDGESSRLQGVMVSALENANYQVRQIGLTDPAKQGAGTTCAALMLRHGRAFIGHVGDSRIYLVRQGAVHQLTADHTLVEHAVAQGYAREAALAKFPTNPLVRAIGRHEKVFVDSFVFDALPGDAFLICSDGLHDYFGEQDHLAAKLVGEPAAIAQDLVDLANHRGGRDNITALVVRVSTAIAAAEEVRHARVQEDMSALWHMPLFHDMTYAELLEIVDAASDQMIEAEAAIVTEGEASDSLYVVAHGRVRVERGGQTIAELGPGCHFGEMAVLTSRPRTATVRAAEPTRVLALSRAAIHALFSKRPAIGMKFLWTLAQVQSIRLDEAQVWDTDAQAVSRLDQEETVVIARHANGEAAISSRGAETQRYPPPLSRHH